MGREVRRVSKDWKHPKERGGKYRPLFGESFSKALSDWVFQKDKWEEGFRDDWSGGWKPRADEEPNWSFEEWYGEKPSQYDYMPDWSDEERTHLQMYETCSEGTPISPVMETPEELAKWLTDNKASAFALMTATYEEWLSCCKKGWVPSAVCENGELKSGVRGCKK